MTTSYHLIASPDTWIEGDALHQLAQTAALPGMRAAVGLPDLHPGKGYPIGAAFLSERIYPALVGNDIGCGMALWQTDLSRRKFKPERAAERLQVSITIQKLPGIHIEFFPVERATQRV
jgi:release factor H-coupled RctB family protein